MYPLPIGSPVRPCTPRQRLRIIIINRTPTSCLLRCNDEIRWARMGSLAGLKPKLNPPNILRTSALGPSYLIGNRHRKKKQPTSTLYTRFVVPQRCELYFNS